MRDVFRVINDLIKEKILDTYAVGVAVAALFYEQEKVDIEVLGSLIDRFELKDQWLKYQKIQ